MVGRSNEPVLLAGGHSGCCSLLRPPGDAGVPPSRHRWPPTCLKRRHYRRKLVLLSHPAANPKPPAQQEVPPLPGAPGAAPEAEDLVERAFAILAEETERWQAAGLASDSPG